MEIWNRDNMHKKQLQEISWNINKEAQGSRSFKKNDM